MGTRWRGVLAPINQPTGDGRRMAVGAFTHRPLPLPLRWQRTETNGHDDAVTIGVIDTLHIDDAAGHVWGEGELFDDVSPATNPRLAEDVREAMFLTDKGTIGPSVDPGHAAATAVIAGTDTPVAEQSMFEAMVKGGTPPKTEMLFTAYEIAGATLVPVPAFGQCRPLELGGQAPASLVASEFVDARAAILAAAALDIDPSVFADPGLDRITPITRRDLGNGLVHVFGHIAEHLTCLVGRRDMCITPPYSSSEYSNFHRYHQTPDGGLRFPLPVGRLTAGFGSLENTCRCCPGNDDHACANLTAGQAIAHHDRMQVLAYVRAGEDERNNAIWVSGIEAPGIDEQGRALLARQKVSGDWRENRGDMELTEVLVLNRRSPGFPLPRTSVAGGRQRALTAAGAIMSPMDRQMLTVTPDEPLFDEQDLAAPVADSFVRASAEGWGDAAIDYDRLAAGVAQHLMEAADPEGEFGFNKNQKRGPDGRWIGMGGAGSAGGRRGLPGRREGVSRTREGGGAGAGGNSDSGRREIPDEQQHRDNVAKVRAHADLLRKSGDARMAEFFEREADQFERALDEGDLDGVQRHRAGMAGMAQTADLDRKKLERKASQVTRANEAARRRDYNEDLLGEAQEFQDANLDEGDFDDELQEQIDIVRRSLGENPTSAATNRAVEHLRQMLLVSYADEDELPGWEPAITAAAAHTGAMIALVPTAQDAARLAVTDGETIDDLHATIGYLGEAADVPEDVRERLHDFTARRAAQFTGPIQVNASDLTYFNPGNTNGFETALVLGLSGEGLGELHDEYRGLDLGGWQMPAQHTPYKPHVTLQYTNDMKRAATVVDRVGPVTFDRLRLAFGGEVTDFPLGPVTQAGGGYDIGSSESMMSDTELRARAAAALLALATGEDATLGFNKNQRRGPDGKWVKMGGAGAGGDADSGGHPEAADASRELREIADQLPNQAVADNVRKRAADLDAAVESGDQERIRVELNKARLMAETQRRFMGQDRAREAAEAPRPSPARQRRDGAIAQAREVMDDPDTTDQDRAEIREQIRRIEELEAGGASDEQVTGEVDALEELLELLDFDEFDDDLND